MKAETVIVCSTCNEKNHGDVEVCGGCGVSLPKKAERVKAPKVVEEPTQVEPKAAKTVVESNPPKRVETRPKSPKKKSK